MESQQRTTPGGPGGDPPEPLARGEAPSRAEAAASDAPGFVLERIAPRPGRDGQEAVYGFVVKFLRSTPVTRVRLEHDLPEGVTLLGADPRPIVQGNRLVWMVGDLSPDQERRLLVKVRARPGHELPSEASATLQAAYTLTSRVGRPQLSLSVIGPDSVRLGDAARFRIVAANSGTAPAKGLRLKVVPPDGLEHPELVADGIALGVLAAGEQLEMALSARAVRAGKCLEKVALVGADGEEATADWPLAVVQAELALHIEGSARCTVAEEQEWGLSAANPGSEVAEGVLVEAEVPAGWKVLGIEGDAIEFQEASGRLAWRVGDLPAGHSRRASLRFSPGEPGDDLLRARATADRGLAASAEASLAVDFDASEPAHLLEDWLSEAQATATEGTGQVGTGQAAGLFPFETRRPDHLIFSLGGADFAMPMDCLVEVGRPPAVTHVPDLPDWVLGVTNVRGDVVSMIDLRAFLAIEGPPAATPPRMIVVRSGDELLRVGMLIDRIVGIRPLADQHIEAGRSLPEDDRLTPYVRRIAESGGRLVVVLDPGRLLGSPAMRQFEPI